MGHMGLLNNLEGQIKCYRNLLHLARRKKDILIEGKVQELDKIIGAEQVLILEGGRLEEERLDLLEEIGSKINLAPEKITRHHLLAKFTDQERERFTQLEGELKEILRHLHEENQFNQHLIKQSLDYIEFSRGLLTNAPINLLDEEA
ncbi:MAG: flagellar protein FlgN [Firmicutes bacterium]|nr:flagellar protein FlgN [Bacillota bacterium]